MKKWKEHCQTPGRSERKIVNKGREKGKQRRDRLDALNLQ